MQYFMYYFCEMSLTWAILCRYWAFHARRSRWELGTVGLWAISWCFLPLVWRKSQGPSSKTVLKKRIEMQCFWDRPILGIVHICSWYLRNEMTDKDFNFGEMVRVCIVDEDKLVEVWCFLVEHVWAMQVLGNVPMIIQFPLLFLISMYCVGLG